MTMPEEPRSLFFRHCDTPTLSPVAGTATGQIPSWLKGTFLQNGPGIKKVGSYTYEHMVDGLAVLHRFHIDGGKVTYNNRPLESDTYQANMAAERIVVGEFGTAAMDDPCDTLFSKFKSIFISDPKPKVVDTETDNCSVNIGFYGDQLYAMTETSCVRRVDPTTLKCIGEKTKISDFIAISLASAHPHVLEDGTVLNLGVSHRLKKGGTHYLIIKVPPTFGSDETSFKNAEIIAEIPSRWKLYPAYYHSFGITKDKIIFIEQPFCFRIPRYLMWGFIRTTFEDCLAWYPSEKTRFYVISMKDGQLHPIVYETENLFTFHHANAYEEDGHLVVDVSGYHSADFVKNDMKFDTVISNKTQVYEGGSARRYVLPLEVSTVNTGNLVQLPNTKATASLRQGTQNIVDLKPEILQSEWMELPRINYKYNGVKHQYIYGCNSSESANSACCAVTPKPDILVKLDTKTGKHLTWDRKGVWVSEPVFVQDPTIENPAEDDGVLLVNLLHSEVNKTTFLVLNAKTMEEVASVEFKTDGPVPITLHGLWSQTGEKVHGY